MSQTALTVESHGGGRRSRVEAPGYRSFVVHVSRVQRLSTSFVRVTFIGTDLNRFGWSRDDQRIKLLLLPQPGRTVAHVPTGPDWYQAWRDLPDDVRPVMRTYTVRAFRPEMAEIDVDLVLHGVIDGHAGPMACWAARARPGDALAVIGPDVPGRGRLWGTEWLPPISARRLVIVGDETAVPAVGAIVESLPRDSRGVVLVEVPYADDIQRWDAPLGLDVQWHVRRRAEAAPATAHGTQLEAAVAKTMAQLCGGPRERAVAIPDVDIDESTLWEVPGTDDSVSGIYAWIAGEAGVVKRLRRLVVSDFGVPRSSVAFMGYWREGRSDY